MIAPDERSAAPEWRKKLEVTARPSTAVAELFGGPAGALATAQTALLIEFHAKRTNAHLRRDFAELARASVACASIPF